MTYYQINDYRKLILKERRINAFMLAPTICFLDIILCAVYYSGFSLIVSSLLIPVLLLLWFCIRLILKNNKLLKELAGIELNDAINKTRDVELFYPKVFFLTDMRMSGIRYRYSDQYYGIRLTDGNKNQYYYFFDENLIYDKESIDYIKGLFQGKITVQCFADTNVIKTISNDPKIFRIWRGHIVKNGKCKKEG